MLIRVLRAYPIVDAASRTPGGSGTLDGVTFTQDPVEECDGVIIANFSRDDVVVRCPPENVWAVVQEPYWPGSTEWINRAYADVARVYSHVPVRQSHWVRSHPALEWHVRRSRDALLAATPAPKSDSISAVISDASFYRGHRRRLDFVDALPAGLIERFGRGYRPVEDKWEALAPTKYSLAIENSCVPGYWTEKLSDCLLAWCLPFYIGCPDLAAWFPSEAVVPLDLSDPRQSAEIMQAAVAGDEWRRRLDAIAEARRLYLDRYDFFPFFAAEFRAAAPAVRETVRIRGYDRRQLPLPAKLARKAWRLANDAEASAWRLRRRLLGPAGPR